ncbi:YqhV family protein [Desulfofalx alkaliphila]|uniref:YqhV family protein n=1 Tax=Desulfofalx alkaliphila TaxID=105483 RepID=UPI0004E0DDF5|nr:YqhV family protein [Desulfofalx alkaliphila]
MFHVFDKIVFSMAAMRFLSSFIEFSAALLMLKFNKVETAFKINALLALVGPTVLVIVTTLGLVGLAGKIPLSKMLCIAAGVCLIFIGVAKN